MNGVFGAAGQPSLFGGDLLRRPGRVQFGGLGFDLGDDLVNHRTVKPCAGERGKCAHILHLRRAWTSAQVH